MKAHIEHVFVDTALLGKGLVNCLENFPGDMKSVYPVGTTQLVHMLHYLNSFSFSFSLIAYSNDGQTPVSIVPVIVPYVEGQVGNVRGNLQDDVCEEVLREDNHLEGVFSRDRDEARYFGNIPDSWNRQSFLHNAAESSQTSKAVQQSVCLMYILFP